MAVAPRVRYGEAAARYACLKKPRHQQETEKDVTPAEDMNRASATSRVHLTIGSLSL